METAIRLGNSSGGAGVSAYSDLSPGWQAAWAQGWEAYQTGNKAIGAAIVNETGEVLAVGRNRTREARQVNGVISGFDLAHAEVNALLSLPKVSCEEGLTLTLLTTIEPCPQCAGTLVMSQVRRLSYAAADPWAGCASLLSENAYMASKRVAVSRGPSDLTRAAQVLNVLEELAAGTFSGPFRERFELAVPDAVRVAERLHAAGTVSKLWSPETAYLQLLQELQP
ncbi:nucleoside deaminase [Deinococcus psychrotolerans]|uniref:Nucleoside deaminase n=1 Tax=Deinococcus psychrotolerans TaxID=2489213 RepID=A0A3G8YBH4_9DEIO|nr:nucleoside deaminase [Deinococcus psychrotolerans]